MSYADLFGGFYGYVAGYNTLGVAPDLLDALWQGLAPMDRILADALERQKEVVDRTNRFVDAGQVDALYQNVVSANGRLDVLFNNAGAGTPPLTIDEMTPEQWQMVVDVNLTGSFLCAREAFAMMRHLGRFGLTAVI